MTAWASPSWATAYATRRGSSKSIGSGLPFGTAQKPQRRVHRLPSIMNVADFWFQHSPMLGQWALSHTVCRFRSRAIFLSAWNVSPTGARAFNQAGFAIGLRGVRSIWIRDSFWTRGAIYIFDCITAGARGL